MINRNLSNVLTEVVNFTNKHNIEIQLNLFHRNELDSDKVQDQVKQSANWARFEKQAGTYCFFCEAEDSIEYIGMSMSNTGARMFNWLFKDMKIKDKQSPDDLVLIVTFIDQHYMAPALESYLIERFEPVHNREK